jgi:hypothetical protein
MKKLSISFFAILAIVFAVSSAFTTSHKKATTLTNEWYVLKTDQFIVPGTSFEAAGNPAKPINDIDIYEVSDISGTGFAERFTDVQAATLCNSEADLVCAIQLEGADANNDDELDASELDEFLQGSPNYVHPSGILFKDVE